MTPAMESGNKRWEPSAIVISITEAHPAKAFCSFFVLVLM
jgi:hypothetical protein